MVVRSKSFLGSNKQKKKKKRGQKQSGCPCRLYRTSPIIIFRQNETKSNAIKKKKEKKTYIFVKYTLKL